MASMQKLLNIKAKYPGSVMVFRQGDFYEVYGADAVIVSQALGLVMNRSRFRDPNTIESCGFPVDRKTEYLKRLVSLGYRVAICEPVN